jgi:hypothetical protein
MAMFYRPPELEEHGIFDILVAFSSYDILIYMMFFFLKVVEVSSKGMVSTRKVSRRNLLKSSGEYANNIIICFLC